MRNQIIFVIAVLFLYNCKGFFLCNSPVGQLDALEISGCTDLTKTCFLPKNTTVTISIKFTPNNAVSSVTFVALAVIDKYSVNLKVPNSDACACGLKCPLEACKQQIFCTKMPIEDCDFPKGPFLLQLELRNEEDLDIVWVRTFAEIK